VAMAVSSGAPGLEAAVVIGADPADQDGLAAVRDLSPAAPVYAADAAGAITGVR
jgi:hypothetical protein